MDKNSKKKVAAMRENSAHIDNYRKRWEPIDDEKLREMYVNGEGITQMALSLDRPELGVIQRIRKDGLLPKINKKRKPKE